MEAAKVAAQIGKLGLPVIEIEEGCHSMDGSVKVTELVHIQVPTFGHGLCVVAEVDGGKAFKFYPIRDAVSELREDIEAALGLVAA